MSFKNRHQSRLLSGLLKLPSYLFKTVLALLLATVVFVVSVLAFFFITPQFTISAEQIRFVAERFLPSSLQLRFRDARIEILRPKGMPLAKRIRLEVDGLCVVYETEAVNACFEKIDFAAFYGWGGYRLPDESHFPPRLIRIDPLIALDGRVRVDLTAFPVEEEEPDEPSSSGPSLAETIRTQILPKWRLSGTRVELESFELKTLDESYLASFDLLTAAQGEEVSAILHHFESTTGEPFIQGVVRLRRPENWRTADERSHPTERRSESWKLSTAGGVDFRGPMAVGFIGNADIENWESIRFSIETNWQGVSALEKFDLSGSVKKSVLDARASLRAGKIGEVEALSLVNCAIGANLKQQVGELQCGPQMVHLQIRERGPVSDPRLFRLSPEFSLRVDHLEFGETKSADIRFKLNIDHFDFLRAQADFQGRFIQPPEGERQYSLKGEAEFVGTQFARVVDLLRGTPYAIPAPIRELSGPIGFRLNADVSEVGGKIQYGMSTRLNSQHQAVHLDFDGTTDFIRIGDTLDPSTNAELSIRRLYLSAPRFDLKVPPQLKPDSRFRPLKEGEIEALLAKREEPSEPMNFRLRIRTTQEDSIRIATNLTKSPIPIKLDLLYDERKPETKPEETPPTRQPASILARQVRVQKDPARTQAGAGGESAESASVTGEIRIGETAIDLFKRNAVLEELRIDLLPSGVQMLDGRVAVRYLDYNIFVNLDGATDSPEVKLSSDPPLEDNQILAVLLFGRPLAELDDDEQSSVANLNVAFTDAALGLSSLYLLASTPIESVGYNPETQSVTAKVGIGGGTSIEVGSRGDSLAGVGFQKRISREFVLRSDVERIGTQGKRTVSALLEWVRRF